MSLLSQFFLSSPPSVVALDLFEIAHPNFSQTYRIVRNAPNGVSVTHEGPAGPFAYSYYPARVLPIAGRDDLVQALSITLGDLGAVLATEIENIWAGNGLNTRPSLIYREYRSDSLGAPMDGPYLLEIVNVTTSREGATFEARAPELNASRTGELYSVEVFPMLKAFQ